MRKIFGAVLACVIGAWSGRAAAINIDSCGVTVSDNDVAVLTADLNCPDGTTAVRLGKGSTLNMDGHSIEVPNGWGVWCNAAVRCTVTGGGKFGAFGEIRGGQAGVYLQRRARLSADSLVIRDCETGVSAEDWNTDHGAYARLTNVQITGSEAAAVRVGRIKIDNVRIEDNPGNGIAGLSTTSVKAKGLTVVGNAFSAGCQVYGCEGIDVGEISGTNLLVSGNAGIGIHALSAKLRHSTVIDNVRAGSTKDLVTSEKPRLHKVACNVSLGWGSQSLVHWDVCSLDYAN